MTTTLCYTDHDDTLFFWSRRHFVILIATKYVILMTMTLCYTDRDKICYTDDDDTCYTDNNNACFTDSFAVFITNLIHTALIIFLTFF